MLLVVARADELARRADRRHKRQVRLRAVITPDVIDHLVQVVRERILRVRPLVELHQDVAGDLENRRRDRGLDLHADVVLPVDLVPHMVFAPGIGRVPCLERLVRDAERHVTNDLIEIRPARVAAVLVAERAAAGRIDRWMPRRIELAVGTDHGKRVVLLLRARVVRSWRPEAEGARRPRGDHLGR